MPPKLDFLGNKCNILQNSVSPACDLPDSLRLRDLVPCKKADQNSCLFSLTYLSFALNVKLIDDSVYHRELTCIFNDMIKFWITLLATKENK